jgi:anti-anti-sigma regulatory factor
MQASTTVTQRAATTASKAAVVILAFSGDISSASKDAILAAYHGLEVAASPLLLDFTAVDYINSSGIGIFGLSPHFKKVFTMVGISKYANLYEDEKAALA